MAGKQSTGNEGPFPSLEVHSALASQLREISAPTRRSVPSGIVWGIGRIGATGLRLTVSLLVLTFAVFEPPISSAQSVDPRLFGFVDIPAGELRHPAVPKNVLTADQDGQPVVGQLYVGVGEHCIIRLPNGHLEARRRAEMQPTERPFAPLDGKALEQTFREKFPNFRVKRTKHHLFIYNTSEPFAAAATGILDSMYPGVTKFIREQRIATHSSGTPLVVVMFATEQEFQAFQRVPPNVEAYYDTRTNYVVLREPQVAQGAPTKLVISQTLATIAHEGAHQILANIGVHQRLAAWPPWIAEGLAEYLAPTTVDYGLKWAGHGMPNHWRMFELEQYFLSHGRDKDPGELLEQTVSANRLTSTGYAVAWWLTDYLVQKRRVAFQKYLKKCSEIRPLEGADGFLPAGANAQYLADFRAAFGDDLSGLGKHAVHYLTNKSYVSPFSDRPHFVAEIVVPGPRKKDRFASFFLTEASARKWSDDMLHEVPQDQRPNVESFIREFPNRGVARARLELFLNVPN